MTMTAFLMSVTLLAMMCIHLGRGAHSPGQKQASINLEAGMPLPEHVSGFSDLEEDAHVSGHSLGSNSLVQECLKQRGAERIVRELNKISNNIKASLPRDNIKHLKLLPKLRKPLRGIAVMKEILDFYSEDVFSKVSPKIHDQEYMLKALSRLIQDMNHCLLRYPSALSPKQRRPIKTMKHIFKELNAAAIPKAVGEFNTVLDWLVTYMHERKESDYQ